MEQIYKYRSYSASMASGYKLFRSNIKTILFKSWIEALAFGLAAGLSLAFFAIHKAALFWCAVALTVVAFVFWNGRLFLLIDGGKAKDKLFRAAKATAVFFIFMCLPLVGVPLINVIMEIMLEDKPRIPRSLVTGFRHWGYLFLTLVTSGLIMALLSVIICVPLYICVYGLIANHLGMAAGDPNGLPASFPVLLLFVGTLTVFMMLFVQIWQTYALAYAHGAIRTRDELVTQRKEEKMLENITQGEAVEEQVKAIENK